MSYFYSGISFVDISVKFENNKDKTVKITTYDNRDGSEIETLWF